jgi:hypothetical protein
MGRPVRPILPYEVGNLFLMLTYTTAQTASAATAAAPSLKQILQTGFRWQQHGLTEAAMNYTDDSDLPVVTNDQPEASLKKTKQYTVLISRPDRSSSRLALIARSE